MQTHKQKAKRSPLPSFSSSSSSSSCVVCTQSKAVVPVWPYSGLLPDPGAKLYRGGLAKQGGMD